MGVFAMKLALMESLKIGHDAIDDDHAEIIDSINAISRKATRGDDQAAMQPLLEQFLCTCEAHFRKEEGILESAGYPLLAEHTAYHDDMLIKARTAQHRCITADSHDDCLSHLEKMMEFLVDDIVRSDMGFASYLQAQGLARVRG